MNKIFNFFKTFESEAFVDFTGPLSYMAKSEEDIAKGASVTAAVVQPDSCEDITDKIDSTMTVEPRDDVDAISFPSFPGLSSPHSLVSLVELEEISDKMNAAIKVQHHYNYLLIMTIYYSGV